MCGIAGSISPESASGLSNRCVSSILEGQHRRGPDFRHQIQRSLHSQSVTLGHNRLAIVDIDARSNQPFCSPDDSLVLVFNGEIYNYIELRQEIEAQNGWNFHTGSDTEVLLAAYAHWGKAFVERLNGMFAFALLDRNIGHLLLVRDRYGVKPLYIAVDAMPGVPLVFASSAREIARATGKGVNNSYVSRGLNRGVYDGFGDSAFAGIDEVAAGTLLDVDLSGESVGRSSYRYYNAMDRIGGKVEQLAAIPVQQAVEEFRQLFDDSVRLRLRADVPVALSISGGLDSSCIAARAGEQTQGLAKLTGFSLGSPHDRGSEGPLVAKVGQHTGLDLVYCDASNTDVVKAFEATVDAQEAPFPGLSVVAQNMVYRATVESGVRVLLGGQGADEALLGYRKFNIFHLQSLFRKRKIVDGLAFSFSLLPMVWSERFQWQAHAHAMRNYMGGPSGERLLNLEPGDPVNMGLADGAELWQRSIADLLQLSIPTLLRYEDRNSMYHSIESRLPFMDYRLLEYMIALPVSLKLRHGYGKWLLRQASKGWVPEEIRLARYKRGFDVPHKKWVRSGIGELVRQRLQRHSPSVLDDLAGRKITIDSDLPAKLLETDQQLFNEAVSLLWMAENHRGS